MMTLESQIAQLEADYRASDDVEQREEIAARIRELHRQIHERDSAMKCAKRSEALALRLRAVREELKLMDMGEIVLN